MLMWSGGEEGFNKGTMDGAPVGCNCASIKPLVPHRIAPARCWWWLCNRLSISYESGLDIVKPKK